MEKKWANIDRIEAKLKIQDEVLHFIHFHVAYGLSPEKIREQVLMNDAEEKKALQELVGYNKIIRDIKRRRWATWKAICYALGWEEGKPPEITPIRRKVSCQINAQK
jgi:hypothetical protein